MRERRCLTLLEVAITLTVIGIIALVTYQASVQSGTGAQRAVADLYASRVVVAQQNFAASSGAFTDDFAELSGIGRDVQLTNGPSTRSEQVSVFVSDQGTMSVAALGGEGDCYVTVVLSPLVGGEMTKFKSDQACTASLYVTPDGEPTSTPL